MPGITLTLSGEADQALVRRLVPALTSLTSAVLDKKPEETTVLVKFVPAGDWFIGGKSLAELKRNAFRLEVTVTDETTTKDQKAAYQKAAFDALSEAIRDIHPRSNVHVIDCRASAYGYGGVTQEHRYQRSPIREAATASA
jgi:4-oxalocrotonate tautomerase